MLKREDMLELTRRMTVARCNIARVAGAYMDPEGYDDGTFNTHFLKLSKKDQEKHLQIAKAIPFSDTNEQLKEHSFPKERLESRQMWQLLEGLRSCELKNDALMANLYEYIGERYQNDRSYCIEMFYGSYDIPLKGSDKEEQWESEEVYDYLICAISPITDLDEYEIGQPECGFLYPSFKDRSCDREHIAVFDADGRHQLFLKEILGL